MSWYLRYICLTVTSPPFLDVTRQVTFQTELGQLIDLITAPEDHVDLSKFSLDKHQKIVVYKTAFYSFYLPVALAMRMVSRKTRSAAGTWVVGS
jgi:geranylgeranyl pyrophosphate synthase